MTIADLISAAAREGRIADVVIRADSAQDVQIRHEQALAAGATSISEPGPTVSGSCHRSMVCTADAFITIETGRAA